MDDTLWAIEMSDEDTAPDYYLDALKNARDLGEDEYVTDVIATAAGMLADSAGASPLINTLLLGTQAFGRAMTVQMTSGPIKITFEVSDASPE